MRTLLIIIFCFWAFAANAQNKPGEVNIYGHDGKSVIGKVLISPEVKSKLLLLKSMQKKDTSNTYTTTFYLGNKETGPVLNARIVLQFNNPVAKVSPSFATAFNNMSGLSDDHKTYVFKAGRLDRDPGSVVVISFTIKSRERIVTEISGLDGMLQ